MTSCIKSQSPSTTLGILAAWTPTHLTSSQTWPGRCVWHSQPGQGCRPSGGSCWAPPPLWGGARSRPHTGCGAHTAWRRRLQMAGCWWYPAGRSRAVVCPAAACTALYLQQAMRTHPCEQMKAQTAADGEQCLAGACCSVYGLPCLATSMCMTWVDAPAGPGPGRA